LYKTKYIEAPGPVHEVLQLAIALVQVVAKHGAQYDAGILCAETVMVPGAPLLLSPPQLYTAVKFIGPVKSMKRRGFAVTPSDHLVKVQPP
jgi:hypothetical protein